MEPWFALLSDLHRARCLELVKAAVLAEREACAKEALAEAENWKEGESGWAACTTVANRIHNRQ